MKKAVLGLGGIAVLLVWGWAVAGFIGRQGRSGPPAGSSAGLELLFPDLDGGQAIVVSAGESAFLLDAGPGALDALRRHGLRRLEALLLTNFREEHAGGGAEVLRATDVAVGRLLVPPVPPAAEHEHLREEIWQAASARPSPLDPEPISAGQELSLPGGEILVLGPLRAYRATGEDEENSSVVLRLRRGPVAVLLPSDIGWAAEAELTSYGEILKSRVLVVPRHGADGGSTLGFLSMADPEAAVVIAGRRSPPSDAVIRKLSEGNRRIWRTDLDGGLRLLANGGRIRLERLQ